MQQGGKALVGCGLRGKCLQPAPKNLLLEARLAAGPVRMLSPPGYTRKGHLLGLGVVWLLPGTLATTSTPCWLAGAAGAYLAYSPTVSNTALSSWSWHKGWEGAARIPGTVGSSLWQTRLSSCPLLHQYNLSREARDA